MLRHTKKTQELARRYFGRLSEERGATMVEYIILVAVLALALIAGAGAFAGKVNKKFEDVGTAVSDIGVTK